MATVGVVIPVYFGQRFLPDALNGVRAQDFSGHIEVVVVEDGTPAEARCQAIAGQYGVEYRLLENNRGVFAARLAGAEMFSHPYLAFLDQDDVWAPSFLRRMIAALERDLDLGFVACNARVVSPQGSRALYRERRPSLCLPDLKVANQLVSPSQTVIRRQAYEKARLTPDLSAPGADDWLMWLAILASGYRAGYLSETLVDYRDHDGGAHHQQALMRKSEEYVVDVWFPRLGFTRWDQRLFYGRRVVDDLVVALRSRRYGKFLRALGQGGKDPLALWAALEFRRRHRREGIV